MEGFGALNDQVAVVLRERIIRGELAPGDRILEADLADKLSISRGTLRAALQQLSFEGLLVQRRFKSTFVAELKSRDAFEIYTLRNSLEALAARLAAVRIDAEGRLRLANAITTMQKAAEAGDTGSVVDADFEIHHCIVAVSGHSRLQAQYSMLESQVRVFLRYTASVEYDLMTVVARHRDLVEAVVAGDAERAEMLARDMNTADGERMVALLREKEADRG